VSTCAIVATQLTTDYVICVNGFLTLFYSSVILSLVDSLKVGRYCRQGLGSVYAGTT
jgi:hypothetical protein